MEQTAIEPIMLIVCIVPRGRAERVTALCLDERIAFHLTLLGRGTADSDILDYLGLGETEKDVVLLSVRASIADAFLTRLSGALSLDRPGHGIAFRIPLSSVAERSTLQFLSGYASEQAEADAGKRATSEMTDTPEMRAKARAQVEGDKPNAV